MKELLCEAYSLLFDIDTTLKSTIAESMSKHYGLYWRTALHESIDLNNCYLHELTTILFRYPQAFSHFQPYKEQFNSLILIRNKICHMQSLNDDELSQLKFVHDLILSF